MTADVGSGEWICLGPVTDVGPMTADVGSGEWICLGPVTDV